MAPCHDAPPAAHSLSTLEGLHPYASPYGAQPSPWPAQLCPQLRRNPPIVVRLVHPPSRERPTGQQVPAGGGLLAVILLDDALPNPKCCGGAGGKAWARASSGESQVGASGGRFATRAPVGVVGAPWVRNGRAMGTGGGKARLADGSKASIDVQQAHEAATTTGATPRSACGGRRVEGAAGIGVGRRRSDGDETWARATRPDRGHTAGGVSSQ